MKYRVAYDCKLRRPGCVILQAVFGGTVPSTLFQELFPAETWLVSPTDHMQVYETTLVELQTVANITRYKEPSNEDLVGPAQPADGLHPRRSAVGR